MWWQTKRPTNLTGFKLCLWKSILQNFSNEHFTFQTFQQHLRIFLRTCYFYLVFNEYLKKMSFPSPSKWIVSTPPPFPLTTQSYFNLYEETNLWFTVLSTPWTKNSFLLSGSWWLSVRYRRVSVPKSLFSDILLENILWSHYTALQFVLPFV